MKMRYSFKYINTNRIKRFILLLWAYLFCTQIAGCLSAGTHGAVKAYSYKIPKYQLQTAVNEIITENPNIRRKPITDSLNSKFYNDGETYISLEILKGSFENDYTIRFGGDQNYWDTATISYLIIAYAFDEEGNGGSEGDGGLAWYKFRLRRKLINTFETEFINKLDKEVGVKHTIYK